MTRTMLIAAGFLLAALAVGPLPSQSLASMLETLHVPADRASNMAHGVFVIGGLVWALQLVRARLSSRKSASDSCA